MNKYDIINAIFDVEQGYVDHDNDRGGKTRFGITEKVARNYGYNGTMNELPKELAYKILCDGYYDAVKGDELLAIYDQLALECVDSAVLMGAYTASKILQQAVNYFISFEVNKIIEDGKIGTKTINAIISVVEEVGVINLISCMNALQGMRFINICNNDSTQKDFINGWFNKRVEFPENRSKYIDIEDTVAKTPHLYNDSQCGKISSVSVDIALESFFVSLFLPDKYIEGLQTVINAFYYKSIAVDGIFGENSINALKSIIDERGEKNAIKAYISWFVDTSKDHPIQQKMVYFNNFVVLSSII